MNNGHLKVICRAKKPTRKNKNWVNIRLHGSTEKCVNLDATYLKNPENPPEEVQIDQFQNLITILCKRRRAREIKIILHV